MQTYKTTAGIEVHCELKSKTKMFSDSPNVYHTPVNTNINAVDFAYPGTLPTINAYAVELALKAAILFHCKINKEMVFDRKNYFYPDLPKGYQITQARTPIGVNGYIEIETDGVKKKIRIHDIHIEEDTCKSTHIGTSSLLDFNRNGVPLIEIVSEPDMANDKEALLYLEKMRELLLYADISDCKMEEGSMRCDVNVSVSQNETLGTRTETKNVGSLSSVGACILSEAKRQIEVIENGGTIREETRRYDEKEDTTMLMRVKETGNDYRYFPEPDLPMMVLEDAYIEKVEKGLPIMPEERRKQYQKAGIVPVNIEKLIQNKAISDYLLGEESINLVIASNLLLGDIAAYLNKNNILLENTKLTKENFRNLVSLLEKGTISSKQAKDIIPIVLEEDTQIEEIIKREGMEQITDNSAIEQMIAEILDANEDSIKDYNEGKDRAIKYLMGQVMKVSKGKVNPALANQMLLAKLKER
ncbi:MAG: Asp-tRNA(Asn)/Glu-tRNA(Gln) amidotransferase subunit GatB [Bacilli bacterium]|nr:Asp-tRNA(Asn)/Glu-tRNA(Gln) amidotransferase subunit GatB [Bacilli bacterium]